MAEKISIIDDNENLLTSLAIHLQTHGYNVKTFTCPQLALNFHIQEPADFYVIDIKMPQLTGIEFRGRKFASGLFDSCGWAGNKMPGRDFNQWFY